MYWGVGSGVYWGVGSGVYWGVGSGVYCGVGSGGDGGVGSGVYDGTSSIMGSGGGGGVRFDAATFVAVDAAATVAAVAKPEPRLGEDESSGLKWMGSEQYGQVVKSEETCSPQTGQVLISPEAPLGFEIGSASFTGGTGLDVS